MPYVGRQPTPSPVTADDIPDTVEANLKSGRKNLIINGAMQVAQRGTSISVANDALYTDRFKTSFAGLGAFTATQSSDAPDGFANSLKFDCDTADASPSAGDYFVLHHNIEGQNLQHLKKGTASAEAVTLSFWIKSNKTGTLQLNLRDVDNTRNIGTTFTIDASATWEKKTLTFVGDTTGAFGDDNGNSLSLELWLGSGTNYTSGAVPTSWESAVASDRNAGGTINLADSTSNYLNITGIQLELGSQATDFEHRSYGEELALCQRYYHKVGGSVSYSPILTACFSAGNAEIAGFVYHPVEMRVVPTF